MRGLRIIFICELWETLRARSCESSLISDKLDILDNGFFERPVTGTSITEMVKKRELQDNNVTLYQLVGKIIFLISFVNSDCTLCVKLMNLTRQISLSSFKEMQSRGRLL